MLGVDQDSRVCIIEMKNEEVTEDILPQILKYAIWAETNPDSIKAIWLECPHKPEDIELDWDNLEIRVIVVAPAYRSTVPRITGKIGYPIDLIHLRRFVFVNDEFLVVDTLEEKPQPKRGTTKVMIDWDWNYYESEHGQEATGQFRNAVEHIQKFVKKKEWDLPYNLNKYYTGFKLGNRVVFSVGWGGTHAWNVRMKLPKDLVVGFESPSWEFQRHNEEFHEATFRPRDRKEADLSELEDLLVTAYKYVSGTR